MAAVEIDVSGTRRDSRNLAVSERHIGQLLIRAGKLHDKDITKIIAEQRLRRLRFGETAIVFFLFRFFERFGRVIRGPNDCADKRIKCHIAALL